MTTATATATIERPITNMGMPVWITDIIHEVQTRYGFNFKLSKIHYSQPRQPGRWSGGYYPISKKLDLCFSREKTDINLFVLLHELSHAIQRQLYPQTLTKTLPGHRRVLHNRVFFRIAGWLYYEYGILDTAIKNEYKRGRKILKEEWCCGYNV